MAWTIIALTPTRDQQVVWLPRPLGKSIREALQPLVERKENRFPFDSAVGWVKCWERIQALDAQLLQSNIPLTLCVVQNLSTGKAHYRRNVGELDRIFPRSKFHEKHFQEAQINHFANFWIPAKGTNPQSTLQSFSAKWTRAK